LRRFVPSVSRLTYDPLFRAIVNSADIFPRWFNANYRRLPPNHMRIRVGGGNRIFGNQPHFLLAAPAFWIAAFAKFSLSLDSRILDLGSGCGRYAHHLRDLDVQGIKFNGEYVGIDVDDEMLDWCRENYDARFRFIKSTHASTSYKASGTAATFEIPEPDASFDFIFSRSLFTHLLEKEMQQYLSESWRLLRPGGAAHHSFFCVDAMPQSYGRRHTFAHRRGAAHIESEAQP